MTNEDSFFSYLDEEYNKFNNTVAGAQLDIPLIASTIHYSTLVDLEKFEETSGNFDKNYDNFGEFANFLNKDQTVSFYAVAKDKLGSVTSLFPGQKRLLGHVVDPKIIVVWVDFNEAGNYWANFASYFSSTISSTTIDIYMETPTIAGFIKFFNDLKNYKEQTGSSLAGLKYDAANTLYEVEELLDLFSDLFDNTSQIIDANGNAQPLSNDNLTQEQISLSEQYVPESHRDGLFKLPVPLVFFEANYGYEEYKDMKQILLDIKGILREDNITVSSDSDALEKAKNSNDSELRNLYASYKQNMEKYEYSYTHYLQTLYIPFTYFYNEEYTTEEINVIVDEIYDQRDFYNYLVSEDYNYNCSGSCTYSVNGKSVSNLKVRLLQCSGSNEGTSIPGENLIDFEKYILGVVYAELGDGANAEAVKAQAIVARNYALTLPSKSNSNVARLEKENGEWILSIGNCADTQRYCSPDRGCSMSSNSSSATIYSGTTTKSIKYKDSLVPNSVLRTAVSSVSGKILLDNDDILEISYSDSDKNEFVEKANNGENYSTILMSKYQSASRIADSNCSNLCTAATGDYTQWKQLTSLGAPWGHIEMAPGANINDYGCTATSIAIQIARSKVPLTIPELNPGTFVQKLRVSGGFDNNGNITWNKTTAVAPNFVYIKETSLRGLSQSTKASTVQNLINEGCYLIMEVKGACGGQHWVAVDYVGGNTVYMMDPASTQTNAWIKYNQACATRLVCYKVS